MSRLKQETRVQHDQVERMLGLVDSVPTTDEYRGLLRRFYGYYEPVERRLAALAWNEIDFDLAPRCKVPLLERDLSALGDDCAALAALPRCPELPPLDTVPQALGCLYVLEGATLGGQVITRHLSGTSPGPVPAAFFASYGPDVGPMWKAFGASVTDYAAGHDTAGRSVDDIIVDSARRTFDTLGAWLGPTGTEAETSAAGREVP